jgi:hypothetical protein
MDRIAAAQAAPIAGGGCMIHKLLSSPEVQPVAAGQVAEFHMAPDDCRNANEITFHGLRPVQDFVADWDFALLDRRYDEPIWPGGFPAPSDSAAYVGIVHDTGAFLVEVIQAGVRQ